MVKYVGSSYLYKNRPIGKQRSELVGLCFTDRQKVVTEPAAGRETPYSEN